MAVSNNEILVDFVNRFSIPVCIINEDDIIIYLNKIMTKMFGNLLGETSDIIFTENSPEPGIKSGESAKPTNQKSTSQKQIYKGEALYNIISHEVNSADGSKYSVRLLQDITEQNRIEAELKNSYNKLLEETKFAKGIQQSLLPIGDNYSDIVDLQAEYLPAEELCGDMFDIIKLSDDEVLFYIADVSGHGIRAALLTIFLKEVVKGMAELGRNEGLDKLLNALLKDYSDLDIDIEVYFSIVLCKYNRKTQELSLANAGHNCFPIILRKKGRIEEIPLRGMPITKIGFADGYEEETVGIYPGDRIILYTDGIVEEYSETMDKEFGAQGVRNVISTNFGLSGKDLCRKIVQEAEKHSKTKAEDDRSIVVVTIL